MQNRCKSRNQSIKGKIFKKKRKSLVNSYPNRASILISLWTWCKWALAWGPVQANVNLMNYHLTDPNKLVRDRQYFRSAVRLKIGTWYKPVKQWSNMKLSLHCLYSWIEQHILRWQKSVSLTSWLNSFATHTLKF